MRIGTRCQCVAYSLCFSLFFLCAYFFFFGNSCLVIIIAREITFSFFFPLYKGAFFLYLSVSVFQHFLPPF